MPCYRQHRCCCRFEQRYPRFCLPSRCYPRLRNHGGGCFGWRLCLLHLPLCFRQFSEKTAFLFSGLFHFPSLQSSIFLPYPYLVSTFHPICFQLYLHFCSCPRNTPWTFLRQYVAEMVPELVAEQVHSLGFQSARRRVLELGEKWLPVVFVALE